tara:strand:- start:363 stop:491 length:129 start_codon:yes stop_codon:yes gene_type:complete
MLLIRESRRLSFNFEMGRDNMRRAEIEKRKEEKRYRVVNGLK